MIEQDIGDGGSIEADDLLMSAGKPQLHLGYKSIPIEELDTRLFWDHLKLLQLAILAQYPLLVEGIPQGFPIADDGRLRWADSGEIVCLDHFSQIGLELGPSLLIDHRGARDPG